MNTPKSRKPRRWKPSKAHSETGKAFYHGIRNPKVGAAYGFLVSYWWHVEEVMSFVFQDLIDGKRNEQFSTSSGARNMFRTVVSQEARIKLMRALLESAQHNANAPKIYDDILDEFAALNVIRNNLVHGSWATEVVSGAVTVRKSSNVPNEFQPPEKITATYINRVLKRMMSLHEKASVRGGPYVTLLETHPQTENEQGWPVERRPGAKSYKPRPQRQSSRP